HGGIFNRHASTLSHVWLHGVTCIAQHDQTTTAPQRQRITVTQWPLGNAFSRFDQILNRGMIAFKCGQHLFLRAVYVSTLEIPGRMWHASHKIVFITFASGVVHHHVTVVCPPFHTVLELVGKAGQVFATDQGTVCHPAAVNRVFYTQQGFTDLGVDAIGTNHNISRYAGAIGKFQQNVVTTVHQILQTLAKVHGARLDAVNLQSVHIATVHSDVRRTVFFLGKFTQRDTGQVVARFAITAEPEIRVRTHIVQCFFQTHAAENLHHVGAHVDTGTQTREFWRLFKYFYLKASLLQQSRRSGSAKTGPYN